MTIMLTTMLATAAEPVVRLPTYTAGGVTRNWQLSDSRYGYVARYSLALADRLEQCQKEPSLTALLRIAPHRVTASTVKALQQLADCPGNAVGDPFERFASLETGSPPPTVLERAHVLAMQASPLTPDYDRTFWDLTGDGKRRSADPESLLTWGPWRATAGQGCTLQSVLRRVDADPRTQERLRTLFAELGPLLDGLLARDGCSRAKALLQPLTQDHSRAQALQLVLASLADEAAVREIYDRTFYGRGGYRLGFIEDYVAAWRATARPVTEIDMAFFFERSLQFGRLKPRQVQEFVAAARSVQSAWELRRLASRIFNFPPSAQREYQVGRDVTYYIDGAGESLDAADRARWVAHSRVRASDVGLQDGPLEPCAVFPLKQCKEGLQ